MTIDEIFRTVKKSGKSISRPQFYRLVDKLGIKPLAARQRPQQYQDTSAELILKHYGLSVGVTIKKTSNDSRSQVLGLRDIRQRAQKGIVL